MEHDPVGEAIRSAFDRASGPVTLEEVATRRAAGAPYLQAPLAGWAVALTAAMIVIGGIAVTVRVTGPTEPPPIAQPAVPSTSPVPPTSPTTPEQSTAPSPTVDDLESTMIESIGLEGWSAVEIPTEYARCGGVKVWTGSEIVLWGGPECSEDPAEVSGVAYDPETTTWRVLPEAPIRLQTRAGIWSGSEIIVCCGEGSSEGAAYDPETNTWRDISDSPLPAPTDNSLAAVWTGTEMLVVGNTGVAAYDPQSDSWRTFGDPPHPYTRLPEFNSVVWTGSVAVIWPTNPSRIRFLGLTLDPSSGDWEVLPIPPAWPAVPDLVWAGTEIIVWGGLRGTGVASERAVGSRFDMATETWTPMSEALPEPTPCECNLGSQTLVWTGEELIVATGKFGTGANVTSPTLLSYRPDTDQWTLAGEMPGFGFGEGLMAGNRVVLFSDRMYLSDPAWVARGEPIEGLLQPYRVTYENPPRGFRMTHPSDWYRATEDLTPRAGQSQLIAVGTSRLSSEGPRCSHMPVRAMEDMGTTDVFIQLEDWGVASTDAAPRPAGFGSLLAGIDSGSDAWNCLSQAAQAEIGVLRWFPFQDEGRSFLLLVVIGNEATAEDRAEAAAILDSIEIEPA